MVRSLVWKGRALLVALAAALIAWLAVSGPAHFSKRIAAFRYIPVVLQNSSRILPFSPLLAVP